MPVDSIGMVGRIDACASGNQRLGAIITQRSHRQLQVQCKHKVCIKFILLIWGAVTIYQHDQNYLHLTLRCSSLFFIEYFISAHAVS